MPHSRIARIGVSFAIAFAMMAGGSAPARAQAVPPLNGLVIGGASTALIDNLKSHKHLDADTPKPSTGDDSVPPPISDSDQTKAAFLLPAVDYQFKIGYNFGEGPTGSLRGEEPGSVDGGVIVRIEPRTRVALAYYELSTTELGVDTGTIPVKIQQPNGTVQGVLTQENLQSFQPDPTTKVQIYVFAVERLFTIKKSPLVATFAYDSQNSIVYNQRGPILSFIDNNSKNIFIRDAQHYSLVFSEPFVLNDQKLFIVFNEQFLQLVHTAGFNEAPNHPQFLYSAFFQYDINEKASFFMEPAKNVVYFPTDRYPNHQAVFVYGLTYKFRSPLFFQASITNLTTTNPDYDGTGRIGITNITVPCPASPLGPTVVSPQCRANRLAQTTAPTFGGTKLATINLSVGIGTPPVYIPF